MGKAIGVGGVFLHLKGDKQELYDWYEKHLKLDMSEYGTGFIKGKQLMLVSLVSFEKNSPVINFRVDDLDDLSDKLKTLNTQFVMNVESFSYGKFARFIDPFGNLIELWEANEDEYIKMVKAELKAYKNK